MAATPPQGIDRSALAQIRALCDEREHGPGPGWIPVDDIRAVLDAVSVTTTPPQGIDRDALLAVLREHGGYDKQEAADEILALVRPVEGVTLTREERHVIADALENDLDNWPEDQQAWRRALAARLEAS